MARRWFAPFSMAFCTRSAQLSCRHGTVFGATGNSSPTRTYDAISAPPKSRTFEHLHNTHCSALIHRLTSLLHCTSEGKRSRRTLQPPLLFHYRRLLKDGQRLRCLPADPRCHSLTPPPQAPLPSFDTPAPSMVAAILHLPAARPTASLAAILS